MSLRIAHPPLEGGFFQKLRNLTKSIFINVIFNLIVALLQINTSQMQTDFGNVQKGNYAQRLRNDGRAIPRSRTIIFHSRVAARRISAGGFPRSERRAREHAEKNREGRRK